MLWASRLQQPTLCFASDLDYTSQTPACGLQRTLVGARRYPQGNVLPTVDPAVAGWQAARLPAPR